MDLKRQGALINTPTKSTFMMLKILKVPKSESLAEGLPAVSLLMWSIQFSPALQKKLQGLGLS